VANAFNALIHVHRLKILILNFNIDYEQNKTVTQRNCLLSKYAKIKTGKTINLHVVSCECEKLACSCKGVSNYEYFLIFTSGYEKGRQNVLR